MVVNFRVREISRSVCKLIQIPIIINIKKQNIISSIDLDNNKYYNTLYLL